VLFDTVLVVLAVVAQVEIWTSAGAESEGWLVPLTLLWTLVPFARRRFPFGAPVVALFALAGTSFVAERFAPNTVTTFVGALVLAWLVAAGNPVRQALLGLATVYGLVVVVVARDPQGAFADGFFVGLLVTASWGAGAGVYHRTQRAAMLEARVERAERERETAARIAVAEERARIARELHDIVAHSVSVMVLQTGGVRLRLGPEHATEREALESVEQAGREALAEMRRLLGVLRTADEDPELGPQPGLGQLDRLVAQIRDAGMPVELRVEGEPAPLPAGVDLSAYRIVQEGLTNALRHAGPARAEVVVRYARDAVEVAVLDDGAGPGPTDGRGHGLAGMRERVRLFGGELQAGARAEGGFALRARLPVAAPDA
jgi:signal transduction histidine kinase